MGIMKKEILVDRGKEIGIRVCDTCVPRGMRDWVSAEVGRDMSLYMSSLVVRVVEGR